MKHQQLSSQKEYLIFALDHLINALNDQDPDEIDYVLEYLKGAHEKDAKAPEPLMIMAFLFYLLGYDDYTYGILMQLDGSSPKYQGQIKAMMEQLAEEMQA